MHIEATVKLMYAHNIYVIGKIVKCCCCLRTVGVVSKDGNIKFTNTRVLSYKPMQLNFGQTPGQEVLFTLSEEKRSLKAPKRKQIEYDQCAPPAKRFKQNLDSYHVSIESDDIIALPYENLPIIAPEIDDFSEWFSDREYFSDTDSDFGFGTESEEEFQRYTNPIFQHAHDDVFFGQETVPYPSAEFNDLPDYDSDSSEQPPLVPFPGTNYLPRHFYLPNNPIDWTDSSDNEDDYGSNNENRIVEQTHPLSPAYSYIDEMPDVSLGSLPSAFAYDLTGDEFVDQLIPEIWHDFIADVTGNMTVYEPSAPNE